MQSPSLFGAPVMQSPGLPPPPPYGPSTAQVVAPPGGFSNYTYSSQLPAQQVYGDPAAMHSQLYRPTEAEAAHGIGHSAHTKSSRFDRFGNLEKGVNKWLKKLDQKIP